MAEAHRLSSIELLPEAATPDINWAINELNAGRRTDNDILFEFNDRLAVIGLGPISRSAFGRYALKKRKIFAGYDEAMAMTSAFAEAYGPDKADDFTIMLVQMLKTAIYNFNVTGDARPKEILDMARALAALLSAQRMSAGERQKAKSETRDQVDQAFDAAEAAMESGGRKDGADVLRRIREDIYGIFER
ncbi:MAG: DUF3486 family protein [Notoacmeibacter sp.]|nr:DUF3486 family protein [Notoacmeibacter sp.]